uniref:Integrase zinc-binding domain-containing protein n=1 Tax=Fagus sylvatica TaxID=28930 RepID=A0A2N9GLU5_FAGSY
MGVGIKEKEKTHSKKPLRLYLASNSQAIGTLIAQENSSGVEQPVYYLSQYEIVTETPTAIKSQAIADLLAQFPGGDNSPISDEVPGEIDEVFLADLADSTWTLRFDGSTTAASGGVGIILYKGEFSLKEPSLAQKLEAKFSTFEIEHVKRNENRYTNALVTLGSQIAFEGEVMEVTICKKMEPITELLKKEFEELSPDQEDWRTPIKAKLILPRGVLAQCISMREARKKLLEILEKTCGDEGAISLYRRLQRLGYFWPNMSAEAADVQSQCPTCQFHHSNEEVCATFISTDWCIPFLEYLLEGILPPNPKNVYSLKRLALKYFVERGTLFRKGYEESHAGEYGEHQGKKRLYQCLLTLGFSPFSLICGTNTISPTELVVPRPRVMQGSELEVDANMCAEARMTNLEGLDEARELAKARSQRNYQKMANVYSKALRVRVFVEEQMVLKAAEFVRRSLPSPSKFSPNWDGPYIVQETHESGYYKLSKSDGTILADPINGKWLKHYYS